MKPEEKAKEFIIKFNVFAEDVVSEIILSNPHSDPFNNPFGAFYSTKVFWEEVRFEIIKTNKINLKYYEKD